MLKYPKNPDERMFHAEWFKNYNWFEYNAEKDLAFCYACRVFNTFKPSQKPDSIIGLKPWVKAEISRNTMCLLAT